MSTYLAEQIRAVAAHPTNMALAELPILALQIERIERFVNEIVDNAAQTEAWRSLLATHLNAKGTVPCLTE